MISIVTIVKNEEDIIESFLNNIKWIDEIVIVDNKSSDQTVTKALKYTKKIYSSNKKNLGKLKNYCLSKSSGNWILLLDTDERITDKLQNEIRKVFQNRVSYDGFKIKYENYIFNHRLKCRAQKYSKIRLFKKSMGFVTPNPVHEEVQVKGKIGELKGEIEHYSFRTPKQIIRKFTRYAMLETPLFWQKGERGNLKRFTLYPLHMFWSIFIKDQGYKDHIWGFLLAGFFMYYEFARSVFLFLYKINPKLFKEWEK